MLTCNKTPLTVTTRFCVELEVQCGGTAGKRLYGVVRATFGQTKPVVLPSPAGGQVRQPETFLN